MWSTTATILSPIPPLTSPRVNAGSVSWSSASNFTLLRTVIQRRTERVSSPIEALGSRWRGGEAAVWEDPDDGSGSDYDDEEDERDVDFESDWEEDDDEGDGVSDAGGVADGGGFDDGELDSSLAAEVEQMLKPEERAILYQNGAPNLDRVSTAKWKPLHTLTLSGQIQSLDKLLKHGVKIDSIDKDGRTALHIAVIGKKDAVISHLLRKGANPRVLDEGGATPLHYAVQVGALQTVKLLIKHGADVNVSDDVSEGWTPLHVAMQARNRDVAKALLIHGANKSRENEDGKTPVDICFSYGKDFDTYNLAKLLKMMPAK
ncbi:Ankyrin repeat domain-containing protein [Drosera capensis]